jgi:hypothetical protein
LFTKAEKRTLPKQIIELRKDKYKEQQVAIVSKVLKERQNIKDLGAKHKKEIESKFSMNRATFITGVSVSPPRTTSKLSRQALSPGKGG